MNNKLRINKRCEWANPKYNVSFMGCKELAIAKEAYKTEWNPLGREKWVCPAHSYGRYCKRRLKILENKVCGDLAIKNLNGIPVCFKHSTRCQVYNSTYEDRSNEICDGLIPFNETTCDFHNPKKTCKKVNWYYPDFEKLVTCGKPANHKEECYGVEISATESYYSYRKIPIVSPIEDLERAKVIVIPNEVNDVWWWDFPEV